MSNTPPVRLQPKALALAVLLATGLPAFSALAQAPQAQQAHTYSIAPGPLEDVLTRFTAAAGIAISFDPALVAGLRSNGLNGGYTGEEGLAVLLQGTGLEAVQGRDGYQLRRIPQQAAQLAPVTVTGGILGDLLPAYAGGQVATGGSLGLLGATDVMDSPFSSTNYTAELLHDQQARTLADVVVNDASVRTTTSTGGFGEDFQIRGFAVGSGDVSVNGLYGLVSSSRVPVQIVDRVEVLKGPGTLIRGIPPGGSVGGSINIVTKRAPDEPLNRITLSHTGASNITAAAEVSRRYGDDKAWGIRLNAVERGGEATIEDGKQNLGMAAVGVDYRGDRVRWSMDAIHQEDEIEGFRPQIGFLGSVTKLPSAPDGDTDFYPGTRLTQRDSTLMSRLEYDFSDTVTGHVAMGYREGRVRQIFPNSGAAERADADGNFTVRTTFYDSYSKTFSSDAGLSSWLKTGSVDHRLALGVTHMNQENGNAYTAGTPGVPSNIYHPAPLPPGPAQRPSPRRASETQLTSVALADTMYFADGRVLLTLGARHQTVDVESVGSRGYRASAVSPVAGLVIKPRHNVSLYANFTEGLTRGTIVGATYANPGQVLAPYKSKQHEAGVKVDWGKVTTTAAVYQITRPAGYADANNVYDYFGEQRNRGLELTAYGEVRHGLRLMASAAFMQGELTKTQNGVNEGNRAAGVPRRTFNLGADWDTPWVRGLSLNARAIHTSDMYLDNDNIVSLPSVTRYDVGARFRTVIAGKQTVLRATVENVADKRYWLAAGTYATHAAGRTLTLSASVDF